jgi:Flp pilus assembly pilin Flp
MCKAIGRLKRDERGLTTVEYVIVLCLISALAVATWQQFGDNVRRYVGESKDAIETEMVKP